MTISKKMSAAPYHFVKNVHRDPHHPSRQTEKGRCMQQRPFQRRNGTQVPIPVATGRARRPSLAQPFFFLESRS